MCRSHTSIAAGMAALVICVLLFGTAIIVRADRYQANTLSWATVAVTAGCKHTLHLARIELATFSVLG